MSTRQVVAIVGAGVGFLIGGPKGAQWGYAIGSVVGGYVDPTKVYGPRLEDAATQTSTVGGVIPFGYGVFTCTGNIIWTDELKEHKKSERAGKGSSQKNITYTYTRSYAIGVCEGQIFGYLWIKKNGKLVYASDPAGLGAAMGWTGKQISDLSAASAKFLQETTLYYGSDVQMPDSTIVAVVGVGNVSPFRDLAYIVKENEDLTDTAGAVSQYEFCIRATPPEAYLTSLPYSQFFQSEAMTGLAPTGGNLKKLLFESDMQDDNAVVGLAPTGGVLYQPPPQNFYDAATAGLAPTGGELKPPPPQNFKDASTAALAPTGGTLKVPPIGTMQAENVAVGFGPTGGELQTVIATSVVSLLHFDGADGATSTVDQMGLTWTLVGNAHLDTARAKFGASALLLDGSGDYAWASDPTLNLGGGDYTVEGWAYYDSTNYGAYRAIFSTFSAQQYGRIFVLIEPDGDLFYGEQGPYGSPNRGGATATKAPFQTWFHWAAVRSGTTLRLFKDGVKIGEWTNQSVSNNFAGHFRVGRLDSGSYEFGWLGSVDELRITKGVALYTEDFIPPTAPFPNP